MKKWNAKFFTDFLFVGAGPACLSGAIRLRNQIDDHNDALEAEGKEPLNARIMILEKGSDVGAHGISGAVLDQGRRSVNCSHKLERR